MSSTKSSVLLEHNFSADGSTPDLDGYFTGNHVLLLSGSLGGGALNAEMKLADGTGYVVSETLTTTDKAYNVILPGFTRRFTLTGSTNPALRLELV